MTTTHFIFSSKHLSGKRKTRVELSGRLGSDVELRNMPDGRAVVNFTLATNEYWYDGNGERNERTEWHRIVAFGPIAEAVNRSCEKGTEVVLEGKLHTRKWQDEDGKDRYTTEIICNWFKPCAAIPKAESKKDTNASDTNTGNGNLGGYTDMASDPASSDFDKINF